MRNLRQTLRYPAWLVLLIGIPVAAAVITLALFFFVVFLVLFAFVGVVIGARWWWRQRTQRSRTRSEIIEGRYTVERDEKTTQQHNRPG